MLLEKAMLVLDPRIAAVLDEARTHVQRNTRNLCGANSNLAVHTRNAGTDRLHSDARQT